MWITKLQLNNIKSYGPDSPPIIFRSGVNLIQGKNGAGKSTILEAIGLALFDSKPYNLGQFVREGARSGSVTVGFVSAQDEREYEIVRSVGSSSQMYAYDPDAKRKICEGKEDTTAFIRQHLNVEPETDLKTLFEDAVGVPQGTMTAIFRESASVRKEKFNRLLGIDSYEQAWHILLKTGNHIKALADKNTEEQAELRGFLSEKPVVESLIGNLTEEIREAEGVLSGVESQLQEIQIQLEQADHLKQQLDGLNSQLRDANAEADQLAVRQEQAASALLEAEQAHAVVQETAPSEKAYSGAQEALLASEDRRTRRDNLQRSLSGLDAERLVQAQRVETLQQWLAEVAQAEAQLVDLEPMVAQQGSLEEALQRAEAAAQRQHELAQQLDRQTEAVETMRGRFDVLKDGLPGFDVPHVAPIDPESPDLNGAVLQLRDAIGGLEARVQGWQGAVQRAEETASEHAATVEKMQARAALLDQLSAVESAIQEQADRVSDSRLQLATAEKELASLSEHRALLGETGAVCPVCRQPVDVHAQDAAQAHYAAEQQRLEQLLEAAAGDLDGATAALDGLNEDRQTIADQLAQLPVETVLDAVTKRLERAEAEVQDQQRNVQAVLVEAVQVLEVTDQQLDIARDELSGLTEKAGEQAALRGELDTLDNPRHRCDLARAQAARREDLERQLDAALDAAQNLQTETDALQSELVPYSGLDDELAALRTIIAENEQAHQRYLANQMQAAALQARQEVADTLEEQLTHRMATLAKLASERDTLAETYDAEHHAKLNSVRRKFEDERLTVGTRLKEWRQQLADQQVRLDELAEKQEALVAAEATAQRLADRKAAFDFVRQAIRDAGPQITQQLVRLISEQANHIFGDILGDHSFILNWSAEYGISINSRGDERNFELLSGGEQMVAAMSVRLALLTQLATVRFAFFDEPTTNLDDVRRAQLAERLSEIHSLQQLFVISHDDTFEQESYHVIQVYKDNGFSQVEML